MNILTVSGALHREYGGPPMAVTGAAASLATLGHQVNVLVCGQSVQDIQINSSFFNKLSQAGAKVEVLRRSNQSKYGTALRFHELKSVWGVVSKSDFVILHQVFKLQYIAILPVILLLKKPYVVMPHGTLTTYQRKQHKLRKLLFYPATYSLLNLAKAIFVATGQEKSQLPRYLQKKGIIVGLGIDGLDQHKLKPLNSPLAFKLLYMGRITKKKRLDIAIQAFALANKKSDCKMKFIVCGSGEERDMVLLKELVVALQIEKEVEFRGWVDQSEKEMAFTESDCFILTSEDENFAIAAAEALSHGIPCILSSNVALASLVSKHNAGVVFGDLSALEIEKAIIEISKFDKEVLNNSSLRAASELSWGAVVLEWESSINLLLKN
jgi:glycosyltransferase involved in cell wall biosynthesis